MMEPVLLQEVPQAPTNEAPPPPVDPIRPTVDTRTLPQKLDALKAEVLQQIQAVPPEPAQPVQPQAPDNSQQPPTEVPAKFMNPDGTPNVEKIQQSTLNLEQALAKYREREKEFTKQRQQPTYAQPQAPQPVQPAVPQTFEAQIEADLAKEGAARVLAKLFTAAKDAAKAEAMHDVQGLQQEVELQKRDRELEGLSKRDPWVLTEQGFNTLSKLREDKPWLNAAPHPWDAAYRDYLAEQQMTQRAGSSVVTPNPKGPTAPVAPAVPMNRAPVSPTQNTQGMTKDQISSFLAGKSPAEVAAFYGKLGLPWEKRWAK